MLQREHISSVILDAPFTSSELMIKEFMKNELEIIWFVWSIIFNIAKNKIKKVTSFDVLGNNEPHKIIHHIDIDAYFIIGEKDTLVNQKEFIQMFEKC